MVQRKILNHKRGNRKTKRQNELETCKVHQRSIVRLRDNFGKKKKKENEEFTVEIFGTMVYKRVRSRVKKRGRRRQ